MIVTDHEMSFESFFFSFVFFFKFPNSIQAKVLTVSDLVFLGLIKSYTLKVVLLNSIRHLFLRHWL